MVGGSCSVCEGGVASSQLSSSQSYITEAYIGSGIVLYLRRLEGDHTKCAQLIIFQYNINIPDP